MYVFGPNGILLDSSDSGIATESVTISVTSGSTYYIGIPEWAGGSGFTVTYTGSPVLSNPIPLDGATVTPGSSGQVLTITVPGATGGTFYYDDDNVIHYNTAATISGNTLTVTIPYQVYVMDVGTNYWYVEATNAAGTTRYPPSGLLEFTVAPTGVISVGIQ